MQNYIFLLAALSITTMHAADQTFVSSVYVHPLKDNSFRPFEYNVLASKNTFVWDVARCVAAKNNLTITELYYYAVEGEKWPIRPEDNYPFFLHKYRDTRLHIVARQNKKKQNF